MSPLASLSKLKVAVAIFNIHKLDGSSFATSGIQWGVNMGVSMLTPCLRSFFCKFLIYLPVFFRIKLDIVIVAKTIRETSFTLVSPGKFLVQNR